MTVPPESIVVPFPDRQKVREEAGAWVMRVERGLTEAERRELDAWLGRHGSHVEVFLELAKLWDDTGFARELAALFPLESPRPPAVRFRPWKVAAAAVTVAVVAVWASLTLLRQPADSAAELAEEVPVLEYETLVGAQSTVHLPDSSSVKLNTNSAIEVRYTASGRDVELVRGEAFFEVRADSTRPFVVHVGGRSVRAIGTAFNVRRGASDDFRVMVTEGVVSVQSAGRAPAATAGDPRGGARGGDEIRVDAGQSAVIDEGPVAIEDVGIANLEDRLSWQRGMLIFEDEPLADVLAEVGRYTTVVLVPDESLRSVRVGGYFRAGDIDGLLFALRENFGIEAVRTGDDRVQLRP